ncbi:hypothetical protein [Nostoc sp. UHCC 0251]|uniref:hypothetical protein n=1 Tax=Nostoc sp. UHCC 0251 TaxID=3110240 RepID=UPI002B210412|nr:hypothetical protein [Nostoc sp. UHCC 0251]MEA5623733.1 hypothetical protein [Nostoc sp. UHCC 0251]
MASIAGKVAIITGASQGVGRAMSSLRDATRTTGYAYALKLAGNGASIVVNYAVQRV